MRKWRLLTSASKDFADAVIFYSEKDIGLAKRFVWEFEKIKARISEFPESGSPRLEGSYRIVFFTEFPYGIAYHLSGDEIIVEAVAHCARRPHYWR